jgi:hypothetical protein
VFGMPNRRHRRAGDPEMFGTPNNPAPLPNQINGTRQVPLLPFSSPAVTVDHRSAARLS